MNSPSLLSLRSLFAVALISVLSSCTSGGRLKVGGVSNLRTGVITFGVDNGSISAGRAVGQGGLIGLALVGAFDSEEKRELRARVERAMVEGMEAELARSSAFRYVPQTALKDFPAGGRITKTDLIRFAQANQLGLVLVANVQADYLYGGQNTHVDLYRADGRAAGSYYSIKGGAPLNQGLPAKTARRLKKNMFDPEVLAAWREQSQQITREMLAKVQP